MPVLASAYDFAFNGIAYKIISTSDFTVEVTSGCTPSNGVLNIPATVEIKGRIFKVIGIGQDACKNFFSSLTEVNIASGVTYIGQGAFSGNDLKVVRIPNTIKTIGGSAYYWVNRESYGLAQYRNNPIEVLFEDGTDTLEGQIDDGTHWLPFPSSYCNPTKIYVGRNINNYLISDVCNYTVEDLTIGDQVTEISQDNLHANPFSAMFYNMRKITFGKGLTHVPMIDSGDKLNDIYMRSTTPPTSEGFESNTYIRATLHVPSGSKTAYATANVWKDFWTIEEYEVTDNSQCNMSIVSSYPSNNAIDIPVTAHVSIQFSEQIVANTDYPSFSYDNFSLKDENGNRVSNSDGEIVFTEDRIGVKTISPLKPNTSYTFTIPACHLKTKRTGWPNVEEITLRFTTGSSTGIIQLSSGEIQQSNNVFSLSGQRFYVGESSNGKLPKGVYIINHKKVIVR